MMMNLIKIHLVFKMHKMLLMKLNPILQFKFNKTVCFFHTQLSAVIFLWALHLIKLLNDKIISFSCLWFIRWQWWTTDLFISTRKTSLKLWTSQISSMTCWKWRCHMKTQLTLNKMKCNEKPHYVIKFWPASVKHNVEKGYFCLFN